jgi:diaminopimelate decarboxylase
MYQPNLTTESLGNALRSALSKGLVREEDTLVMFHDLSFLHDRIHQLTSLFPAGTLHAVAMKANPLKRILEFLLPLGAGAEVASLGELKLAIRAGYPAENRLKPIRSWSLPLLQVFMSMPIHLPSWNGSQS